METRLSLILVNLGVISSIFYRGLCAQESYRINVTQKNEKSVDVIGFQSPEALNINFRNIKYASANRFEYSKLVPLADLATDYFTEANYPPLLFGDSPPAHLAVVSSNQDIACSQSCPPSRFLCQGTQNQSEDCLLLDIYVPKSVEKSGSLPVTVFFHGGANRFGSKNVFYNGSKWSAMSNTIIVVPNFRVGILGWLRFSKHMPGNFAFSDQIVALQWTKKYIKYFGGNSNQITLIGHSAGAANVACHLISPKSPQVKVAVLQSPSLGDPSKLIVDAEKVSISALSYTPVVTACGKPLKIHSSGKQYLKCLKMLPTDVILEAGESGGTFAQTIDINYALHPWDATVDGHLIPEICTKGLLTGHIVHRNTTVVVGVVKDEGVLFVGDHQINNLRNSYILWLGFLAYIMGTDSVKFIPQYYPVSNGMDGRRNKRTPNVSGVADSAPLRFFGDYFYTCPVIRVAQSLSQQDVNVYLYTYRNGFEWTFFLHNLNRCAPEDGVCRSFQAARSDNVVTHMEDTLYQFHSIPPLEAKGFRFPPHETKSVLKLYEYLRNLVTNDDETWKPYDPQLDNWLVFGSSNPLYLQGLKPTTCSLWFDVLPYFDKTLQQKKGRRSVLNSWQSMSSMRSSENHNQDATGHYNQEHNNFEGTEIGNIVDPSGLELDLLNQVATEMRIHT